LLAAPECATGGRRHKTLATTAEDADREIRPRDDAAAVSAAADRTAAAAASSNGATVTPRRRRSAVAACHTRMLVQTPHVQSADRRRTRERHNDSGYASTKTDASAYYSTARLVRSELGIR